MISMISTSCEPSNEDLDTGDHDPSLCAGDGGLEVLGETTVASEPGEGAFDHPALGLGLEGADTLGSRHDLDRPPAEIGDRIEQLVAAIDAVGEDVPQLGE